MQKLLPLKTLKAAPEADERVPRGLSLQPGDRLDGRRDWQRPAGEQKLPRKRRRLSSRSVEG